MARSISDRSIQNISQKRKECYQQQQVKKNSSNKQDYIQQDEVAGNSRVDQMNSIESVGVFGICSLKRERTSYALLQILVVLKYQDFAKELVLLHKLHKLWFLTLKVCICNQLLLSILVLTQSLVLQTSLSCLQSDQISI